MNQHDTNNRSYKRKHVDIKPLIPWAQGILAAVVFLFVLGWLDGMSAKKDLEIAECRAHSACKIGEMTFYCREKPND